MPKINPRALRLRRAKELDELGRVLEEFQVCEAHPLYDAAVECRNNMPAGIYSWGYAVANLILRRPHSMKGVRPKQAAEIFHVLDVIVQGKCEAEDYLGDPFTALTVDIVTKAKSGERALLCAWHLDRHIASEGDGAAAAVHPTYHFQYGGANITSLVDKEEADLGNILLLESPRLAHPPLDAVLAIDFVLSNYLTEDWHALSSDPTYARLVREAQERVWRPYAVTLGGRWPIALPNQTWSWVDIWPQLRQ